MTALATGEQTSGDDGRRGGEPKRQYGCRFLSAPFPECYCMNISGANIPKILHYCSGEYASCRIYIENVNAAPGTLRSGGRLHQPADR